MHEVFRQFPFGLAEISVRTVDDYFSRQSPEFDCLCNFEKQDNIADISIKINDSVLHGRQICLLARSSSMYR